LTNIYRGMITIIIITFSFIHISLITKKNGLIARITHLLPITTLTSLYCTLIFPYLSYCNIVWDSSCKSNLCNPFILQKPVITMICKLPYLAPSSSSFTKLKLSTVEQINRYQILLFMYRFHHQRLFSSKPSNLPKDSDIHDHNNSKIWLTK